MAAQSVEGDELVGRQEVQRQLMIQRRVRQMLPEGVTEYQVASVARSIQFDRVRQQNQRILERLDDLQVPDPAADDDGPPTESFTFEMSHDIPADTSESSPKEVERVIHDEGKAQLRGVVLGWAAVPIGSVGIQIRTGNGLKLIPRNPEDDFIAASDFTDTFELSYRLDPGEKLIARTVNIDTQNSHFVNIFPQAVEVPPEDDRPADEEEDN